MRYYGAHLQRAGAGAEHYYALVNAGWLQAWEALEGTYDGFLNDMVRAWRLAEAAGEQEQHAADRRTSHWLQCRYALIMASIKSLVSHIPPALLTVLIDNSVWTPVRGLAYARADAGGKTAGGGLGGASILPARTSAAGSAGHGASDCGCREPGRGADGVGAVYLTDPCEVIHCKKRWRQHGRLQRRGRPNCEYWWGCHVSA